jgi:hypothetical protein
MENFLTRGIRSRLTHLLPAGLNILRCCQQKIGNFMLIKEMLLPNSIMGFVLGLVTVFQLI